MGIQTPLSRKDTIGQTTMDVSPLKIVWLAIAFALAGLAAVHSSWSADVGQQTTIVAQVKGMSCPFCAYGLRKELLTIPGVKDVRVNLGKSQATVTADPPAKITDAQIRHAIREAGFSPGPITRNSANSVRP